MKAFCLIIMLGVFGTVCLGPIGLLAGVFMGAMIGFSSSAPKPPVIYTNHRSRPRKIKQKN